MASMTRICRTAAAVLALAAVTGGSLPWNSQAAAVAPGRFVTGWIPNWSSAVVTDGTRALAHPIFADMSPFGFSAISAATIATSGTEASLTTAVNALRSHGLPVIPSITDGTGRLVMAGILADPTTRAQHVAAITNLVVGRNYDGIDLDYEGFAFSDGRASWPTTRPAWAQFVIDLGASLHANGKLLSVTVPPIWDSGSSGYQVYSWHERTPGLDIMPSVDRLRLMVYDWSVSTAGALAPMYWVNNVLDFVKAAVPVEQRRKVQMGVPTYGRSWAKVLSGACPTNAPTGTVGVQMENMGGLVSKPGAVLVRDFSGEMKLTYDEVFTGSGTNIPPPEVVPPSGRTETVAPADLSGLQTAVRLGGATCAIRRTVYFPDAETVHQRASAALNAGLSGIAVWAMGYETDDVWQRLSELDVDRPAGLGNAPVGSLDAAQSFGASVRVTGWLMDPEFDLPLSFTVSVGGGPASGPIAARDHRGDLSFTNKLHGFDVVVPTPASPGQQVCVTATGYGADRSPVSICRIAT